MRDGRPYADKTPAAVYYFYSPDRKAEHPRDHLKAFHGVLHADGYVGFKEVYQAKTPGKAPTILEAACMAHVRRKFFDFTAAPAPIAEQALKRIGELYDIEKAIRGLPPEQRLAVRQQQSKPRFVALRKWLNDNLAKLPRKSGTAGVIRYALARWQALGRFINDGTVEIDNNAAENAPSGPSAWGARTGCLPDRIRGERTAGILSLIETCRLNDIDPEAYLRTVLTQIADQPINKISELLPWNVDIRAADT